MTSTRTFHRKGSPSWRPDARPYVAASVSSDDEWLAAACKTMMKGKGGMAHFIILDHHRARLAWCADRAVTFWTDGTRKLAWNAVLQYPTIHDELGIIPRPMPAHIAAADTKIPAHGSTIRADFTHFFTPSSLDPFVSIALDTCGFKFNRQRQARAVRIDAVAAESAAKLAAEYGFSLDASAHEAIEAMRERTAELSRLSGATSGDFTVEGFRIPLFPYQQAGVQYLVATKRAILADDMGLGKTLETLAALQALNAWPAVAVTLPVVKDGWKRECLASLPGVEIVVWSGKKEAPEVTPGDDSGRTLHVINYDILPARLDELKAIGPKAVVFDEAHKCNNPKSKRAKAAKDLAARRPVRIALTGTPSENEAKEILSLIGLIGRLDAFGGFARFVTHYLGAKKTTYGWDFGGSQHLDELHRELRATCFLRRRKEQVQRELPERIVTRVPIALSADGIANYNAAARDVKAWIARKAPIKPAFLASIAHLSPEQQEFEKAQEYARCIERIDGMELLHQFSALRQAVLAAKLPAAVEWLLHHCEAEKMVLFGHHKVGLRGLIPHLGPLMPLIIDGEVPTAKRTGIVEQFQREEHRLLLAQFDAAGTGLDGLQRCASHLAHMEWPWTPGKLRQCGSRLRRTGQKNTVHEWHLYAPGTIDDDSLELLADKATTADLITDGGTNQQQEAFTRARKLAAKL